MNRSKLITLIDALAFIGLTLLVSTGILLEYLLPPGSGRWTAVWGMDRHDWGDVHFWIAVSFFSVLLVHLLLHWRFIVSRFKGRAHEVSVYRLALGLIGLIALIAVALAPLLSPVEKTTDRQGEGERRGPPMYRGY